MNQRIKKLFLTGIVFIIYISVNAQVKIVNTPDAPGKLIRKNNTLQFINSFKVLSIARAASLAKTADKMMDIICRLPQLNLPMGYNAKVNVAASDLKLKSNESQLEIYCYLRYLVNDSRYIGIKESLDGADLYLFINDFEFFHQMGNYWKACSELKFPLFFEEPVLTDSTNDYIEFQYKGDPVRIVTAGSKPLFIPLTRKELLRFIILSEDDAIKGNNDAIKTSRESKELIKKMMLTENESDKAYAASSLKSIDYNIEQYQKSITTSEKEIDDCKAMLQTMSSQDAAAPARLDYDKKIGGTGMAALERMVPVGRKEGKLLVKLNPSFYDHSSGAPAAQMIVMYDAIPMLDYRKQPNYLEQAMLDIFNHIDYHALKMCLE